MSEAVHKSMDLGPTKRQKYGKGRSKTRGVWDPEVAKDPKHRPQTPDRPSTTVRREWCRYPQEAHLLDVPNERYRRLSIPEIARIQGFPEDWVDVDGLGIQARIAALGNAVPPPVAEAMFRAIKESVGIKRLTSIEICAGAGGLALGATRALGIEHVALLDNWDPAIQILRSRSEWDDDVVKKADVREFDFRPFKGSIGILSGGPPCQPWSHAGRRRGADDERDLLGYMPEIIQQVLPDIFVFENVPGLLADRNRAYLDELLSKLRCSENHGFHYGVLAALVNSADYGVPQVRKRVFFVGVKNEPSAEIYSVFDTLFGLTTHRDPVIPGKGRPPWKAVGSILDSESETRERWRSWNG